ncbi:MAG: sugar phosphate nucleotidyltransferase [Promethearchaeota archaeon]
MEENSVAENWCAVILAGGIGSRLAPLTSKIPKPLVPVTNQPMCSYAIDHLRYAGIKHIVVVVKHMGDLLRDYLEKTWTPERLGGVKLEIPQVDSLGTADALRKVSDLVTTDHIVVSMADIVTNLPMREMMGFHVQKGGIGTISMKTIESPSQYGVVLIDNNQKIYLFLEKPKPQELYLSSLAQRTDLYLHTNIINTGIYCFERSILDILDDNPNIMDFGKEVFPYLVENQFQVYGFVREYYWMDVGMPKMYKWANWDLLRNYGWPVTPVGEEKDQVWTMGDSRQLVDRGLVESPSAIGSDVNLAEGARVKTLSVLGSDIVIGANSLVERSVLWDRVRVGENCQVIDSIVCNDCDIGDDVIIRNNSVVGPNCTIGSGTVLDNRVMKEDSRI